MSIKLFRYFFDCLDKQEKWLNKMSKKGYRLINTSKLTYEFEKCSKNEFQYVVEFVADKSPTELKDYITYLEEMNFKVLSKNMNINYSLGKIRWRPWTKGAAQIVTSPGNYNKELLIVERVKSSTVFALHTNLRELSKYFTTVRNAYFSATILLLLPFLLNINKFKTINFSFFAIVSFTLLYLLLLIITIKYSMLAKKYKKESKIHQ